MAASVLSTIKYAVSSFTVSNLISHYYLIATIITFLATIYFKNTLKTQHVFLHLARSMMNVIAYFLYFYALSMTSIANVIALGYTDGILTCLFSFLILKESLTKAQIINLFLSFIGALMIIRPDAHILNWGGILAGISAILWAFANIIVKKLATTDSPMTQLFYSNFFTFLIALLVSVYDGSIHEKVAAIDYLWFILLGFMVSIQFFALFKSLGMANTGVVMPFFILSVIFVHIYGYLFFGETQNFIESIGTILVIAVSFYQILSLLNSNS